MADHSKIGKSNVRKGKTLERRVAKLFTDLTSHKFRRRRVEGRDASVIERESTADVIPTSKLLWLSIEVKSGAGFSLDALLSNPSKSQFTTWWHQATYDANLQTEILKKEVHPFLFFKNSTHDWVAISTKSLSLINFKTEKYPNLIYEFTENPITMNVAHTEKKKNQVFIALELPNVMFMRWKDFAEYINPDSLFIPTQDS